jgi:hypothetical protein
MNREDIIRMAQKWGDWNGQTVEFNDVGLERFAALVAAAERERVIGIAKGMQEELQAKFEQSYMQGVIAGAAAERERFSLECIDLVAFYGGPVDLEAAIRARGETK